MHIFVFVSFSVFSALFVANEPERTVQLVRPLVEDAVELRELAVAAYGDVRNVNWREAADEAVSIYVRTLRTPALLFEGLAERLDEVDRKMSRQRRVDARGHALDAGRMLSARQTVKHRYLIIATVMGPASLAPKGSALRYRRS
ncbi:hypothetical protein DCO57_00695 [Labrenzia sp. 011]|nr:hypothetical protein DCO57_00695 [Labrenzia sp. 011]